MGDINAPQAGILVTVRQSAVDVNVPQGQLLVTYNIPAEAMNATFAGINVTLRQNSNVRVEQAAMLAVVRGSIFNPKLRAWTFDLDAHEMYVINLGNGKTLLLDLTTEKWSWWSSGALERWRVSTGVNWTQSGKVAYENGSDVVVGDDTTGALWILNPEQAVDDPLQPDLRDEGVFATFPRAATGQVLTRGREFLSCYEVYLVCDPGAPAFVGAQVTLNYSDDGGRSYVSAGTIVAEPGNYQQEFAWRSLGIIGAPGRMFRIEDDGALRQIDELSIANG